MTIEQVNKVRAAAIQDVHEWLKKKAALRHKEADTVAGRDGITNAQGLLGAAFECELLAKHVLLDFLPEASRDQP